MKCAKDYIEASKQFRAEFAEKYIGASSPTPKVKEFLLSPIFAAVARAAVARETVFVSKEKVLLRFAFLEYDD
jgi:hypothetical protein